MTTENLQQWYMYVLECSDGTLYCGVTTNVERRVKEHNVSKRGAKYTRSRRPVRLLFAEMHLDRSTALKAEIAFKRLSRQQKVKLLEKH